DLLPRLGPYCDVPAVVGGDVFDDTQSQAGSTGVARAGLIHAVEPFEDPLAIRVGNPASLIRHSNIDEVPRLARAHGDLPALGSVPHRVIDEVAHRGEQQVAVAEHGVGAVIHEEL